MKTWNEVVTGGRINSDNETRPWTLHCGCPANMWPSRWSVWLRHCATISKDVDSISDVVIVIFYSPNLSGRATNLGSTQPLTEMSTRNISCEVEGGDKGGRCLGLTTLQL